MIDSITDNWLGQTFLLLFFLFWVIGGLVELVRYAVRKELANFASTLTDEKRRK